MKLPDPGAPLQVGDETRIVAFICDRLGKLYEVQVRQGPVEWQSHGSVHESYPAALEQAQRVSRRPLPPERPDLYIHAEPDFQPDSHANREARRPAVDYCGDMPTLGGRIRRARGRAGLRNFVT